MLYATIMAGGSGTRFWPASRKTFPKQLLNLAGKRSMLQSTVDRLDGLCQSDQILILTNERLVAETRKQIPNIPAQCLIGEPFKRDTAACIGVAARIIAKQDEEGIMLVMPADHVIKSHEKFHAAVNCATDLINQDPTRIVTFGIKPTYQAQVFGYIERGEEISGASESSFSVSRFREKPDLVTAQEFVDSGRFYWNSGIFVWKAKVILDALEKYEPTMFGHIDAIGSSWGTNSFDDCFRKEFEQIKGKSIDFAVMEKHENVSVVEAPFDWDDVGNWSSLPRLSGRSKDGNTFVGKHLALETSNSIVRSDSQHLVVTLGVDNFIVVHTPDATLVANRNDESAIRQVVEKLEELGWEDYL